MPTSPRADAVLRVQGAYYLATGLWPVLHLRSFVAVTGPKLEPWLVRTVGLLAGAAGGALLAGAGPPPERSARVLAALTAASFPAVDVTYYAAGRLRAVYLADAAVQAALLAAHARAAARRHAPVP